jgi:hypothetical protein
MTDRELLELAAKAAGWVSWDWLGGNDFLNVYDANGRHDTFAPLTDDGDALRLAVKLDMFIIVERRNGVVYASVDGWKVGQEKEEPIGPDQYAATRRAIVRAAAEIGKAQSN